MIIVVMLETEGHMPRADASSRAAVAASAAAAAIAVTKVRVQPSLVSISNALPMYCLQIDPACFC